MKTNHLGINMMNTMIFTEVHLLAGKLLLVVASYAKPSIGCRTTNTR